MSSKNGGGAASAASLATIKRGALATPAIADAWEKDALGAIEQIQDPDAAEQLLDRVTLAEQAVKIAKLGKDRENRWCVVRLKAERRYGELLPPPEPGRRTDREPLSSGKRSTGADQLAANKARKVAAVAPEKFESYVKEAPQPSRSGLLREAGPPPAKPRQRTEAASKLWQDEAVVAWVGKRLKAKRTRDEILVEAKAGEHGWPGGSAHLPQNAADRIIAILADRDRAGRAAPRREPPSQSGQRLRALHEEKRNGRAMSDIWSLQVAVAQATSQVERFRLPDLDWSEDGDDIIADLFSDLERMGRWHSAAVDALIARMDVNKRQRTIATLRARADDPSSTQGERENAARLAAKLAAKPGLAQ